MNPKKRGGPINGQIFNTSNLVLDELEDCIINGHNNKINVCTNSVINGDNNTIEKAISCTINGRNNVIGIAEDCTLNHGGNTIGIMTTWLTSSSPDEKCKKAKRIESSPDKKGKKAISLRDDSSDEGVSTFYIDGPLSSKMTIDVGSGKTIINVNGHIIERYSEKSADGTIYHRRITFPDGTIEDKTYDKPPPPIIF